MRKALLASTAALLLAGAAAAQTVRTVPSALYPTIQSAISASTGGDKVMVAPGIYKELLDFQGKDIQVIGIVGAQRTVIDGNGVGPVVLFTAPISRAALLEGFTVTGGSVSGNGGGIQVAGNAAPTVRKCIIRKNTATAYGGGIGGTASAILVEDSIIEENQATGLSYASGGGVGLQQASAALVPEFRRCIVRNNRAATRGGGLYFSYFHNALIEECLIYGNQTLGTTGSLDGGAGVFFALNAICTLRNNRIFRNVSASNGGGVKYFNVTNATIVNNTIVANTGGAVAGFANTGSYGTNVTSDVINCILWGNGTPAFAFTGTDKQSQPPSVNVTYSDVEGGYTGTGNFAQDPQLFNAATGNHRILPNSPCFNKGNNLATALPNIDFEGDPRVLLQQVDVGADECNPSAAFLFHDQAELSLTAGGLAKYTILGGGSRAGFVHVVLPTFAGTLPGFNLGALHIPINIASETWLLLGGYPALIGILDGSGQAAFGLFFPPSLPPELLGLTLSTAALFIDPAASSFHSVSNDENLPFVR